MANFALVNRHFRHSSPYSIVNLACYRKFEEQMAKNSKFSMANSGLTNRHFRHYSSFFAISIATSISNTLKSLFVRDTN